MPKAPLEPNRETRILDAVLTLLAQHGISGVSMRAVAREAGVALGLVNYYYSDKVGLVAAALRRIEELDVALVAPTPTGVEAGTDPEARLRASLAAVVSPELLTTEYLALRLQLWSLAQAHPDFHEINRVAQERYRAGLAELIHEARPGLAAAECTQRAADVSVLQNGLWLTALLGVDADALTRAAARCEEIALAP